MCGCIVHQNKTFCTFKKHKAAKLCEAELIGATKGNNWEQANTSCRSWKTFGRKTLGQLGPNAHTQLFQVRIFKRWLRGFHRYNGYQHKSSGIGNQMTLTTSIPPNMQITGNMTQTQMLQNVTAICQQNSVFVSMIHSVCLFLWCRIQFFL